MRRAQLALLERGAQAGEHARQLGKRAVGSDAGESLGQLRFEGRAGSVEEARAGWRHAEQGRPPVVVVHAAAAPPGDLEPVDRLARRADRDGHLADDVEHATVRTPADDGEQLEVAEREAVLAPQSLVDPVVEPRLDPDEVREQLREIGHDAFPFLGIGFLGIQLRKMDSLESNLAEPSTEDDMTHETSRTLADERADFATLLTRPVPDDVVLRERTLGGRPALEVSVRDRSSEGVLLYLHGGGFTVGSPRVLAALTAQLARRAGVRVVSLDYRLAPEHPFPAAADDAGAAYRELLDEGVAPERLALAGASAGGNLTVTTLIGARDAGLSQPAAAVIFSPWVDLSLSGDSVRTHEGLDPIFDRAALEHYVRYYVGSGDRRDPLASPLFGRLGGLAPLLVQVGAQEVLLDDAVRLAGRVGAEGGQVTLQVWAGVPHVFQHHVGLLPQAAAALDDAAAFLRRYLGPPTLTTEQLAGFGV